MTTEQDFIPIDPNYSTSIIPEHRIRDYSNKNRTLTEKPYTEDDSWGKLVTKIYAMD